NDLDPRYPFGFGLSYTSFAFRNLRLAAPTVAPRGQVRATVNIENTGRVAGEEVVQLYVGYEGSRVDRPVRELKTFRRVTLAPGETKSVSLEFPATDLAFWDATANEFVVEPIDYVAECGASSRDLPLQARFSVHR